MNLKSFLLLNLIILLSCDRIKSQVDSDLIVEIKNGLLIGKDNGNYYSYESIPFAKAPVGDLRFEAPQAYNKKWNHLYDATNKSPICMQWDQFTQGDNKLIGSEDCLYVNVYKPKTGKKKYPVLAYIHGGVFMFGSVDLFGEEMLMANGNAILVKIAYRVGPLGFLSTEDEVISGNNGLKDQRLALKWIKENIGNFGGDPEQILLMGFSAGGASAHLQMLQTDCQKFVKAVVSFSGVALNPWVINKNARQRAFKLAGLLECQNLINSQALKDCLKQKNPADIVASVKEFFNFGYNPFTIFGPVIEYKNSADAFLTEHPADIIKSGNYSHLPWLASYTAQDGGYNGGELLQINPKTGRQFIELLNDNWLYLAPENLFLCNLNVDPIIYAQQLRDEYMGTLPFIEQTYLKVQEIYTDILYKNGILEALKLHSQYSKAPVFGYLYDNPANLGVANRLARRNDLNFGTVHSDDFSLIMNFRTSPLRSDEQIISQKLINMLVNFAAKGELTFGDCKFENNAGNKDHVNILLITKDGCGNIIQ